MRRVPGLGMHNALPCPLALSTAQAKAFDIFANLQNSDEVLAFGMTRLIHDFRAKIESELR